MSLVCLFRATLGSKRSGGIGSERPNPSSVGVRGRGQTQALKGKSRNTKRAREQTGELESGNTMLFLITGLYPPPNP